MLILFGCNHRSAPIGVRERIAFGEGDLPVALERLHAREGIEECLILSTCNRLELLVRTTLSRSEALATLRGFVASERGVDGEELERHGYEFVAGEAVQHLFHVAAGLDSMILGEPQIHGQVRQAFRAARQAGTIGAVLDRLLQQCLATARRVRRETGISRHAVSVAYAAAHLARQIFGGLEGRRALVVGSGKMGQLVARHLLAGGIRQIRVTSRSYGRAALAASSVNGQPVRWEQALDDLAEIDVVVTCTGASRVILDRDRVAAVVRQRRGRPLFLIDIAVPRDVDPAVNTLDNVYLYDIDGLQEVVDTNLEERKGAAAMARTSIARDATAFLRWRQARDATPTIVALRERLQALGRAELGRFRPRLGNVSEEQLRILDEMVRSLIQKVLHRPVVHLRRASERGDAESSTTAYREIFGLGNDAPGPADTQAEDPPRARERGPQRLLRGGRRD